MTRAILLACCLTTLTLEAALRADNAPELPHSLQVVIDGTRPLQFPRQGRLPLFVLPISNSLSQMGDDQAERTLRLLDARGMGYTVDWNPDEFERSVAEGIRIARLQRKTGQPVAVNANACLYSFFDGSEKTLHVDARGDRFTETSFGGTLGCPFALEHRVPVIRERVERFLRAYKEADVSIRFIFADWEVDGPIEWNDAWATCRRCERCRKQIPEIRDFRKFQQAIRAIRSEIQRVSFGDNVTSYFPEALVGNYGTYPHNGLRYWYDYFEKEATGGMPFVKDHRARYREWSHEFSGTGYTFAMPVVYTWYPTYHWYDFEEPDYRWFYNMLLVGSNAGRNTPQTTPIIPFVHWHTTAPPSDPDPAVRQFSKQRYQELLWHLLLRGHDTFFLWCPPAELPDEVQLVHHVYRESLKHSGFLDRGTPITFDVPSQPAPVVSGLRLGNRALVRRTSFGADAERPLTVRLASGESVVVPAKEGNQVLDIEPPARHAGLLESGGKTRFPIGFYEMPGLDDDLREMDASGVNLVRCGNRADLDRAHRAGMMGWISLPVQSGETDNLRKTIQLVADHPALAVWEGPDEIVWTFTAYSFLERTAGFTRADWNAQTKKAVAYSESKGKEIIPNMRRGIRLVRELDTRSLPFWINEAADSDVKFSRQYMESIDITGCDYYAVRASGTDLQSIGRLVNRWQAIGRGRPVWMVLQAFSWHTIRPERARLYPTFADSRFMAYDAIVHGSKGILYWGSNTIDDPQFRRSLYALTAEISELEPFLIRSAVDGVRASVIGDLFDPPGRGVRVKCFRHASDALVIIVNEDDHHHLGVDIRGLHALEGLELSLLYGEERARVERGGMVTRLQPYQVKVFATQRKYETDRVGGREYK